MAQSQMGDDNDTGYGYDGEKYTDTILNGGGPLYNITFTVNNYNEKHVEFFKLQEYKYLIMYSEKGTKKATPHIQGFISFDLKKKKRISTLQRQLKKYAGVCCWMRPSKGTAIDNKIYCEKDGDKIFEGGNIKLCGKGSQERTLLDVIRMLDEGMTMKQLAVEAPLLYVQYGKRLEAYKNITQSNEEGHRIRETKGVYVYGKTGCLKSTKICNFINKYSNRNEFGTVTYNGKFYAGYGNQEVILMDDIKKLEYDELLNLVNIREYQLEIKNGFRHFNSRMVVMVDSHDFDSRFGTNLIINGVEQNVCKADEEISRRFKKFNFEDKQERKNLFKYIKEQLVEYRNDDGKVEIVDDSDYDD